MTPDEIESAVKLETVKQFDEILSKGFTISFKRYQSVKFGAYEWIVASLHHPIRKITFETVHSHTCRCIKDCYDFVNAERS